MWPRRCGAWRDPLCHSWPPATLESGFAPSQLAERTPAARGSWPSRAGCGRRHPGLRDRQRGLADDFLAEGARGESVPPPPPGACPGVFTRLPGTRGDSPTPKAEPPPRAWAGLGDRGSPSPAPSGNTCSRGKLLGADTPVAPGEGAAGGGAWASCQQPGERTALEADVPAPTESLDKTTAELLTSQPQPQSCRHPGRLHLDL